MIHVSITQSAAFFIDVIPFVTFPFMIFTVASFHFLHPARIRDHGPPVFKGECTGKARDDHRVAVLIGITYTAALVYDAIHSFDHVIITVIKLKGRISFAHPMGTSGCQYYCQKRNYINQFHEISSHRMREARNNVA